jgi:hypothetical protein
MLTEDVVVGERVAEEVRTFEATGDGLVLGRGAHERGHARHVRVHGAADRDAFVLERRVVVVHPVLRLFGVDEGERERADPLLRRQVDGVTA